MLSLDARVHSGQTAVMTTAQLFVMGTPIGNPSDLILRARECLLSTDLWIGESRQGLASLKQMCERVTPATFHILDRQTPVRELGHLVELILTAERAVLVSDAGMPAIADPGFTLAQACLARGIKLVPIPGVSSILAALTLSGFALNHWYYAGFLPRESAPRRAAIAHLNAEPLTTVLMETPYRLAPLLEDMADVFSPQRRMVLAWQLTCPEETIMRGNASSIREQVTKLGWQKGEFVLVIDTL